MDKNKLKFIDIITNTNNINSCIKSLNLDYNSCFICFLSLIEDSIANYRDGYDYQHLLKIANYIERVYLNLTIKEKEGHRHDILVLRKMCKRQIHSVIKRDRNIFAKVYSALQYIIVNNKKDVIKEKTQKSDDFVELLYNIIFNFKSLEYLDSIIEKKPGILNSCYYGEPIFILLINEYLNNINNDDLVSYYERVINKFLLDDQFELETNIKLDIIDTINSVINNKVISANKLKNIKRILTCLSDNNLASLMGISTSIPPLIEKDKEILERRKEKNADRKVILGNIITIDGVETKVFDDALSEIKKLPNGNYLYMVHIADPLALVPYFSHTIREAKKRTSTIYLSDTNIPMINPYFSENKLSLIKGKERFTKTFEIEFDSNFNIVDFRIVDSIIKVSNQTNYASLNSLYQIGGTSKQEEITFENYDKLISSLKKLFKHAKMYEEIKENNIIGNSVSMSGFSENLVSYSMMLVGYLTAKYFEEHDLPYAYRCHKIDAEWIKLLETYSNCSNEQLRQFARSIKGNLPKSYYSRLNDRHYGLGLPYYSHITSPLRRYIDILNMYLINKCYFHNPSDKEYVELIKEIDTTCDYINMQNNTIDECIVKKLIK